MCDRIGKWHPVVYGGLMGLVNCGTEYVRLR